VDTEASHRSIEIGRKGRAVIVNDEAVRMLPGRVSRNCWRVQSAVGCWVRLKCSRRREPTSMATNTYSTRKLSVTTLKKSQATIA
jgi:hypothetical protein